MGPDVRELLAKLRGNSLAAIWTDVRGKRQMQETIGCKKCLCLIFNGYFLKKKLTVGKQ